MHRIIILILSTCACLSAHSRGFIDCMPSRSQVIPGFSYPEMIHEMELTPLHHIEGVWQFPSDGVTVAIRRYSPENVPAGTAVEGYRMILVTSPNRALRPGTVIGYLTPTARTGSYEARIYTIQTGLTLTNPRKFTLTLDGNESQLEFQRHKSAYSFNLWRALPYMFRHVVRKNETTKVPDGCRRLYPAPSLPYEPIYL